jgi:hypothetical protein
MKPLSLLIVIAFSVTSLTHAQHMKVPMQNNERTKPDGFALKSETITTPCSGTMNNPGVDLKWKPVLSPVAISHRSKVDSTVQRLKAERMLLKMQREQGKFPGIEDGVKSVVPVVGSNFAGNTNNGSSPLDNSIAISNGGIIVSVANTTIEIDNTQGQNLYFSDLLSFINDGTIAGVCDPVVIYDSGSDRFVFFCQVSPLNSASSKLLIYFSKSNNPMDGWWYYKLTGNPLNDGSAFDYPKLAVSNNELYISGNLYYDANSSYNQSVIYQMPKNPGYNGETINWQYWHGISGNPFTVTPLSWGQQGTYGPGCYFVASESSDASVIKFYDLTDDMSATNEQLVYHSVDVTAYQVAPNALQPGTAVKLSTNDCRMLSGFYLNGTAHFVFNAMRDGGYCGINYNRLDVAALTNQSSLFGLDGADYCYPSVSSFALAPTDKSVMIGFMKSSSSSYPSVRVVNCDHDMNWSGSVAVKEGNSFVYYTGDPERWGDYSGTCRMNSSSTPTIWLSGMYGNSTNKWDTWIAEVYGNSNSIGETSQEPKSMHLFPNPAKDRFTLEFTLNAPQSVSISILDIHGQVVKELYTGQGQKGKNNFSFNQENLKPGTYFIILKANDTIIKNEKLVVAG